MLYLETVEDVALTLSAAWKLLINDHVPSVGVGRLSGASDHGGGLQWSFGHHNIETTLGINFKTS